MTDEQLLSITGAAEIAVQNSRAVLDLVALYKALRKEVQQLHTQLRAAGYELAYWKRECEVLETKVAGLRDHPSAVQFWKDAYENLKREVAELLEREDR